jgi:hypothetical protein
MKQQSNHVKRLQFYVDEKEYETLIAVFEASGYSSLSAFLRKKIAGNGVIVPYPKELLNMLDNLGLEHQRIGNNINQIAKKVHLYDKEGHFPVELLQQFNNAMISYLKAVNELSRAYRGLIRKFN